MNPKPQGLTLFYCLFYCLHQQAAEAVAEGVGNYAATLAALRPAPPPETEIIPDIPSEGKEPCVRP